MQGIFIAEHLSQCKKYYYRKSKQYPNQNNHRSLLTYIAHQKASDKLFAPKSFLYISVKKQSYGVGLFNHLMIIGL